MGEINPHYLKAEPKQNIRETFLHSDFPAVLLNDFFSKEFYAALKKRASSLDFTKDVVVLHHAYAVSEVKIVSTELTDFVSFITKKKVGLPDGLHFTALLLTWKDYQILNDRYLEKPGIDIVIDLTEGWDAAWGGVVIYTDGEGTIHLLNPAANSLAVVERKKGLQKYIQYLNHHGTEKKRLLLVANI